MWLVTKRLSQPLGHLRDRVFTFDSKVVLITRDLSQCQKVLNFLGAPTGYIWYLIKIMLVRTQ